MDIRKVVIAVSATVFVGSFIGGILSGRRRDKEFKETLAAQRAARGKWMSDLAASTPVIVTSAFKPK